MLAQFSGLEVQQWTKQKSLSLCILHSSRERWERNTRSTRVDSDKGQGNQGTKGRKHSAGKRDATANWGVGGGFTEEWHMSEDLRGGVWAMPIAGERAL